MASKKEKIKELEDLIKKTKYNKRTQAAIGKYKAQLAKLKEGEEARRGKKIGKVDQAYAVRRTGDGTVILVGFPSAGKSTLLNALTGAKSEVAHYAFTTLSVIPGVMDYKFAKIQILDVPGIVRGAAAGTGRGKEVLSTMRNADLCVILLDATRLSEYDVIKKEIYESHIRINQELPDVKITKTGKDGLRIGSTCKLRKIDKETIAVVLREFKINNAEVVIREDITVDQLIDVIEANKKYMPAITIVNKVDLISEKGKQEIDKKIHPDLFISAEEGTNIPRLRELIYQKLNLMNIYLKEPGKEADLKEPMVITKHATLKLLCEKLHKDFVDKYKFARIWGKSVKFDGQKVLKLKHVLKDGDVVELHMN